MREESLTGGARVEDMRTSLLRSRLGSLVTLPSATPLVASEPAGTGIEFHLPKFAVAPGSSQDDSVSVHPFHDVPRLSTEGTHFAHTVPGELAAWLAANTLVAFQEARHEELLGEGRQLHPPHVPVGHGLQRVVRVALP